MIFSRLPGRLLAALPVPSLCAVCHGWGSGRLCTICVQRFVQVVPRCRRCALRVPTGVQECGACLAEPPPFRHALTAVDYEHPWDGLITHFKFHAALDLTSALAAQMLAAWQRSDLQPPSLLLPVPLSDARLRERGHNQAWELTRRLAAALGCNADAQLLLRVKDTPHQLALPPEQRADNVRAAFAIEPRRLAELPGRHVTLVDDVMTTGATLAEAARTLLRAGATQVDVWTLARTPRPGD